MEGGRGVVKASEGREKSFAFKLSVDRAAPRGNVRARRGRRGGGGRGMGGAGRWGSSFGLGQELDDAGVVVLHCSVQGSESFVVSEGWICTVLQEALDAELLANGSGKVKRGLPVLVRSVRVAPLVQEVRKHSIGLLPHHPVEQCVTFVVLNVEESSVLQQGGKERLVATHGCEMQRMFPL